MKVRFSDACIEGNELVPIPRQGTVVGWASHGLDTVAIVLMDDGRFRDVPIDGLTREPESKPSA